MSHLEHFSTVWNPLTQEVQQTERYQFVMNRYSQSVFAIMNHLHWESVERRQFSCLFTVCIIQTNWLPFKQMISFWNTNIFTTNASFLNMWFIPIVCLHNWICAMMIITCHQKVHSQLTICEPLCTQRKQVSVWYNVISSCRWLSSFWLWHWDTFGWLRPLPRLRLRSCHSPTSLFPFRSDLRSGNIFADLQDTTRYV